MHHFGVIGATETLLLNTGVTEWTVKRSEAQTSVGFFILLWRNLELMVISENHSNVSFITAATNEQLCQIIINHQSINLYIHILILTYAVSYINRQIWYDVNCNSYPDFSQINLEEQNSLKISKYSLLWIMVYRMQWCHSTNGGSRALRCAYAAERGRWRISRTP